MDRNYGIGFFLFDRMFGTMAKHHCPLNWLGYSSRSQAPPEKLRERRGMDKFSIGVSRLKRERETSQARAEIDFGFCEGGRAVRFVSKRSDGSSVRMLCGNHGKPGAKEPQNEESCPLSHVTA
jgi:hypothetical protein